jgi:bifunctional non-homologous end joining protein LigD
VVGWTDPEGSRPHLGALLLAYYAPDGRLVYAGRAGTGMNTDQLRRLRGALEPLATTEMPLDIRPPKGTRFWIALDLVARALGAAEDGGRGHLLDLDGRQPPSPRSL